MLGKKSIKNKTTKDGTRSVNALARHTLLEDFDTKTAFRSEASVQMRNASERVANNQARSLAEAIILQSIEDLWNPVCKRGSLQFFEGDGFTFCSELAGISYMKRLATFRMLADAGRKTSLSNIRKSPEGV